MYKDTYHSTSVLYLWEIHMTPHMQIADY